MEVPRPVIEKMTSTGSAEVEWLEDDRSNRPPSFTEWKDAACGHFTRAEEAAMDELSFKEFKTGASRDEQLLEQSLTKSTVAKSLCEMDLVERNRQKLTAPSLTLRAKEASSERCLATSPLLGRRRELPKGNSLRPVSWTRSGCDKQSSFDSPSPWM
jgi:hypothetical protein